ncbi:MAG TPA: type 1 glutamine amidotransferase, partial [Gemmatimonadaceae bacterium]|nr:type 1 glutamine amidotransferase [Gemmatimonadaceae bacterium]
MRAHILHHVPFETAGSIADWLDARHATVSETRWYESANVPDPAELDLVVVMGGTMSVNDEAQRPWLVTEKAFLRQAIARGTPTLGICLGSQMIASALGARVTRNPFIEHGWFPVEGIPVPGAFRFPDRFTTFHSHGETFEIPPGAVRIASSAGCENQAYQIGRHVIGLQFHLESNPES